MAIVTVVYPSGREAHPPLNPPPTSWGGGGGERWDERPMHIKQKVKTLGSTAQLALRGQPDGRIRH